MVTRALPIIYLFYKKRTMPQRFHCARSGTFHLGQPHQPFALLRVIDAPEIVSSRKELIIIKI